MELSRISGETRAHKWLLQDCETNHPACRRPESAFLPNRLIDLRKYPKVCLVRDLVLDSIQDWRYVALSYCWGSSMPEEGKTTSISLEEKLRCIDVQQLPKTVSDAIKFTYRLGVPFLWVDALCIIQDDESDWKREATLMGSIYATAFVTVAAASSTHCCGGFLEAQYSKAEIPMPKANPRGSVDEVFASLNFGRDFSYMWTDSFVNNPLLSRGWSLQERELSPRIIHFTRQFVIWECRQRVSAYIRPLKSWTFLKPTMHERYHVPWSPWPYRCFDVPNSTSGNSLGPMKRVSQWDSSSISFGIWQELVEDFSTRRLTVASDKIPAITGIAEALKDTFKCDLLAGLWKNNLLMELLWYRSSTQTIHDQLDPSTYYAPSWSWAWTNFPILFKSNNGNVDAEILQAIITEDGAKDKKYSSFIVLRARVVDVSIRVGATMKLDTGEQYYGKTLKYPEKTEEDHVFCILRTCKAVPDRWTGGESLRGRIIPCEKIPGTPACGTGLVLRKIDGKLPIYRRVGFVELVPIQYFESLEHHELTII